MVKRGQVASSEEEIKCRKQQRSIDRISMLPDELLVSILSLLTFKEATATSILSLRWRYLWTRIPSLDFDGKNSLLKVHMSGSEWELALEKERRNYTKWVNQVIALHESSTTVEGFRVYFNLDKTYQKYIDKWLRYALARKVRRLELDLIDRSCYGFRNYDENYTFPYKYLHTDEGNCSNDSLSFSMRQCNSIHFKYLQKVSLKYVNVNGEALEFFLCNCPLLEDLSVSHSGQLSNLKIIGPLPSFKRLEISRCFNLNSVEIRDANLVCFKYIGSRISFLLQNVPLLAEISVGGNLTNNMRDVLLLFSSILPQLEKFEIHLPFDPLLPWEEIQVLYSSAKMRNLKHLVVNVKLFSDDSLLPLTKLMRASPCLQSFALEVSSRHKPMFVKRKMKKIGRSYDHLKEVAFFGYRGMTGELELIVHFLENAAALEKILIDPYDPAIDEYTRTLNSDFRDKLIKEEMDARARAKDQLTKILPPRINLDIR